MFENIDKLQIIIKSDSVISNYHQGLIYDPFFSSTYQPFQIKRISISIAYLKLLLYENRSTKRDYFVTHNCVTIIIFFLVRVKHVWICKHKLTRTKTYVNINTVTENRTICNYCYWGWEWWTKKKKLVSDE